MSDVQRWPVDYDQVKQGDSFSLETIADLMGIDADPNSRELSLKILTFAKQIQRELHIRGKMWTVRQVDRTVRILTDSEALPYSGKRWKIAKRGLARSHFIATAIDRSNLSDEEKRDHEILIRRQAAQILGMRNACRVAIQDQNVQEGPKAVE